VFEAVVGVALRAILASVVLGAALAELVFVATRLLALTAATRHALWTTALVATALMPLAGVGVSVWKATSFQGAPPQAARPPSEARGPRAELARNMPIRHEGSALAPSPSHQQRTSVATVGAHEPASVASPSFFAALSDRLAIIRWSPRMSRNLAVGVVGVWVLGALVGLVGLTAGIARVRGLKRRSSPIDGTLADELPWLTAVGPGREIYLRLSYETETPVAIGFRRPVILIPTELATAEGLAAIEQLILHEYAHLRRNDDWTNLVQRTIERVFWFNPVVWLVGRRIALEREIASDDAVVEKTGEAHAYAASLWKLAREMRMPEHSVVAPGALLTRKQITVRIEQLLDAKRGRLHRSPAAALGIAVASLAAVALVASSAPAVELPAESPVAVTTSAPHAAKPSAPKPSAETWVRAKVVPAAAKPERVTTAQHPPASVRYVLGALATPTPVVRERIVKVYERVAMNPPADAPGAATAAARGAAAAGAAPMPPMPPLASFSPEIPPRPGVSQATVAARAARKALVAEGQDFANIGHEIGRAVHEAMATVPQQIAQETTGSAHRTRTDGLRLSRELIASCIGCSFRNADARGVDLHGVRINGDDFTGADLRGANLAGASLIGVSLTRANLSNADLRGAQLNGVELRGAILDGAQLENVHLIGVSIKGVSLRGVALRAIVANCTGCDLSGIDLHGQDLHGIALNGADLSHADLHNANLSGVRFNGVDLSNANLNGADLSNARLDGCDLSGIDLRGARTAGMTMHGTSLGD
jgi:uncharacterized protein YjbI with pentapeptide repeats/beta-lactamase regulating signal transducer with metallopeptidase domain